MTRAPDEDHIHCNQCGAKLYSDYGTGTVRGITCPYKKNHKGECKTPEEDPSLYK